MGGTISQKGLLMAFKRAKQSGVFIVQNAGIKDFPPELCDFLNYRPPDSDEGWWQGQELVRIDLSNNKLQSIDEKISSQVSLQHLNFKQNEINICPVSIFSLKNLKVLDLSNNQLKTVFDAVANAKSLIEFRLAGNQIDKLPDNFGEA